MNFMLAKNQVRQVPQNPDGTYKGYGSVQPVFIQQGPTIVPSITQVDLYRDMYILAAGSRSGFMDYSHTSVQFRPDVQGVGGFSTDINRIMSMASAPQS